MNIWASHFLAAAVGTVLFFAIGAFFSINEAADSSPPGAAAIAVLLIVFFLAIPTFVVWFSGLAIVRWVHHATRAPRNLVFLVGGAVGPLLLSMAIAAILRNSFIVPAPNLPHVPQLAVPITLLYLFTGLIAGAIMANSKEA